MKLYVSIITQIRLFIKDIPSKTNLIRLELDMTRAQSWCEIDAVELVGIRDGAGKFTFR